MCWSRPIRILRRLDWMSYARLWWLNWFRCFRFLRGWLQNLAWEEIQGGKWWLILKTINILFNQAINICFFNINVRIYGRGVLWVFCPEWYFGIIYSSICQQTSILIKNTIWFLKKLGEEGEIQVNIIPHQVQGQKMPARSSPVVENTPSPRFPSYPTIFLPCYFPLLHQEAIFVFKRTCFIPQRHVVPRIEDIPVLCRLDL